MTVVIPENEQPLDGYAPINGATHAVPRLVANGHRSRPPADPDSADWRGTPTNGASPSGQGNGAAANGTPANVRSTPAESPVSLGERVAQLARVQRAAHDGPDAAATARQHENGKLTARERIDLLLDEGSFCEVDTLRRHQAVAFGIAGHRPRGDGVVAGAGTVDGRRVFVYAHDFRVFGGALGKAHAEKIQKVMDLALSTGAPLIGLNDGAGARIQEGAVALAGYGEIFRRNVRASGIIPQISVMLGPCAGGASYSPALTDFVFMVPDTAYMFLTGPDVVQAVTGERVTPVELGGAAVHASRSGLATVVCDDEPTCLEEVRYLLSLLPSNNSEKPPFQPTTDDPRRRCPALLDIVPGAPQQGYDMGAVIEEIVDDGQTFEVHAQWARNVICVLARIDGHVIGVVANQPRVMAGVLDAQAAEKAARFVRLCDAFNIPLVTLVDVPGFLPGVQQEHGGIIRHGAKLLYAYCEATVPRVQIILRKAYGGAYIVMDSRAIGADLSFAWPGNEIAVMGAAAAVEIIFRRRLAGSADPDELRRSLLSEYTDELVHPYFGAEHGLVDDVIDPAETRAVLVRSLAMLREKREVSLPRKHGNPPL